MFRESGCPDLDSETEIVKACDQAPRKLGLVASVEVIAAEVGIVDTASQHVVGGGEDRSRDCNDRLLRATAGFEAQKLGTKVCVVLADGGPRGLNEGRLQPRIPAERPGRAPLAGAFVLPGREPGPRPEVTGGGKAAHVDAQFGDQDGGGAGPDTADGHEALGDGPKGLE